MEVERDVKPEPAGDSEATWSPGPRTTINIPHFSEDELQSLAEENESFGDIDLRMVNDSLDSLFGKLPRTDQPVATVIAKDRRIRDFASSARRAGGSLFGRLSSLR